MGLAKAVESVAKHAVKLSGSYVASSPYSGAVVQNDLVTLAVMLQACVTASDEPIPIGLPVDSDELEQLRTEVKRLELFERAVAAVSGNYRTPEECALKMLRDAGIERGGK